MSRCLRRALISATLAGAALTLGAGTAFAADPSGLGDLQSQSAANDNYTEQEADASATTKQLNLNAPLSLFGWGGFGDGKHLECGGCSDGGDVNQSNDATTVAKASNDNDTAQGIWQGQSAEAEGGDCRCGGGSGDISQEQSAGNSNSTEQKAEADASTYQANVNLPIAILSPGANSGDVNQSNDATTVAKASNDNDTAQGIWQGQSVEAEGGGGDITQSQTAGNNNDTSQTSEAKATTYQVNVNVPIAILSPGANSGDVDQSNHAVTVAGAENENATYQSIEQGQTAESKGSRCCPKYDWKGKYDKDRCGCHQDDSDISQSQAADNSNGTSQQVDSEATAKQKNHSLPFSFINHGGCGCDGGDVDQSNRAGTFAKAGNGNETLQKIGQLQLARQD